MKKSYAEILLGHKIGKACETGLPKGTEPGDFKILKRKDAVTMPKTSIDDFEPIGSIVFENTEVSAPKTSVDEFEPIKTNEFAKTIDDFKKIETVAIQPYKIAFKPEVITHENMAENWICDRRMYNVFSFPIPSPAVDPEALCHYCGYTLRHHHFNKCVYAVKQDHPNDAWYKLSKTFAAETETELFVGNLIVDLLEFNRGIRGRFFVAITIGELLSFGRVPNSCNICGEYDLAICNPAIMIGLKSRKQCEITYEVYFRDICNVCRHKYSIVRHDGIDTKTLAASIMKWYPNFKVPKVEIDL